MIQGSRHVLVVIMLAITVTNLACNSEPKELRCEPVLYDSLFSPTFPVCTYFDYDEAKQEALRTQKGLLLHFTCHACIGDRTFYVQMRDIKELWRKVTMQYLVVDLYIDDLSITDSSKWITNGADTLKRIGDINTSILRKNGYSGAPFFIFESPQGEVIGGHGGWNGSGALKDFLLEGIAQAPKNQVAKNLNN